MHDPAKPTRQNSKHLEKDSTLEPSFSIFMIHQSSSIIHQALRSCSSDLHLIRQNRLLNDIALIKFAGDRGLPLIGLRPKDLTDCSKLKLLTPEIDPFGGALFHPFRIYSCFKILEECKAKGSTPESGSSPTIAERAFATSEVLQEIAINTQLIRDAVDLAVLLEPTYWPRITNVTFRLSNFNTIFLSEDEHATKLIQFNAIIREFISKLDPNEWREAHEIMRLDAARVDNNRELYVLLRLAPWKEREKLRGPLAGALWIRHIGEIIRRAFEDVHQQVWPEEDQGFETWSIGARALVFGSERPIDNPSETKPYLAVSYDLIVGSSVRWYVEGVTEEFAVREILSNPSEVGIELVNLRGNVAAEHDNIALKLRDWLEEDKAQKRLSFVTFDKDVELNVKTIRRQVQGNRVVGFIAANNPDFEFANFTLEELVEIAAKRDETEGFNADVVRNANWNGITNAKMFDQNYKLVSERKRTLKDEQWGRALGRYVYDHPRRADTGIERIFWNQIIIALRSRTVPYAVHSTKYVIDPITFELGERKPQARKRP